MLPTRLQRIQEIYDRLPKVHCRGKCAEACGPIDMTEVERRNIDRTHGVNIPKGTRNDPRACPALGILGTCTVYESRPLVCRLYGGATGLLECPHGCEIEGPPLSNAEVLHALTDAWEIAGEWTAEQARRVRQLIDDPDAEALASRAATLERGALHKLYQHLEKTLGHDMSARYGTRVVQGWACLQQLLGDGNERAA